MDSFQRNSSRLLGRVSGLLAMLIMGSPAAQTTYPEKPIRIVVGSPVGSTVDTLARLLGQKFAETLGKPIVTDIAAGASGTIAVERVAKAAPDGYTLGLLTQGQLTVNPGMFKVSYDPVRDFAPVSMIAVQVNMLVVHNALPAKSLAELVTSAKAQPGRLTYASGGNGSASHLPAELFKTMAGVDILHVPYKGVATAFPDLLSGRITMIFIPIATAALPMVREGKLRALAVTSLRRSQTVPDFPTIAESGYPGYDFTSWQGLLAPAKTPPEIIRRLHLETVKAHALSDVRAKFADIGLDGMISTSPEEFAALIKSDTVKWAKVIKEAGIKPD